MAFATPIDLTVILHVAAILVVVANGGEEARSRVVGYRPQIKIYRLTRLFIGEAVQRDATVWSTVVFAISSAMT